MELQIKPLNLLICLMFCGNALAQSPVGTETEALNETNVQEEDDKILDKSRNYLGHQYIALTETMDNFFAGKNLENETNNSFLKVITQATWFERSDTESDFKLKGKLDLPSTRKRYRLFIDSDPDEQNSLEERNRSVAKGERVRDGNSVAGLEIAKRKPPTEWRQSVSLGAKLNSGFDALVRFRVRKTWVLNEKWASFFRQDVWYLDDVGWGETSRLELTHALSDKSWFQIMTEIEYQDDDPQWQYIHSWRVDQKLSETYAFTYLIGVSGEGTSNALSDNRFINFSVRSRIYDDWVFLHLTPEVFFAKEDDYEPEHAFTLKLEIFLTD